MKRFTLVAAFIFLLLIPGAIAKEYHMPLLTVGETDSGFVGGIADAYLEVKHGSGRIFLDSFPLTKLDTQISTRYANQIACDYLEANCDSLDFFYTIRADSTIVGGPSASAPLTILTIAALTGADLKNDTVMTGTINSGGSIGPVGGILSKAKAAQKAGFKKVLVPKFAIIDEEPKSNLSENETRPVITSIIVTTVNATNYSESDISVNVLNETNNLSSIADDFNLSIELVRISSLDEALPYFIDMDVPKPRTEINVPEEYALVMKDVAGLLCGKAYALRDRLVLNDTEWNKTVEFDAKINASMSEMNYYSAASFCFNMGVVLRKINLNQVAAKNPSQIGEISRSALIAINDMDARLEAKNLTTLSELETYIIVKERVDEAREIIVSGGENLSSDDLAYAIERYYSAVYWSNFFRLSGRLINLDSKHLEDACRKKISEAEERINYADLYLPSILSTTRSDLDAAYGFSKKGNYKMCLFKASFAKAEANLLLSSIAVDSDRISELAIDKLVASHGLISKEEQRGFFPIMGYSYYEYASSLNKNGDDVSSLIFAEYSLELSNLEMYFPKKQFSLPWIGTDLLALIGSVFLFGFCVGVLAIFWYFKVFSSSDGVPEKSKKPLRLVKSAARKRR